MPTGKTARLVVPSRVMSFDTGGQGKPPLMSTVERTPAALHEQPPSGTRPRVSVVIPCLNEAETIEECVTRARGVMEAMGIRGEVVVADNGSEDGSAEIAERAGAHVVHEPRRG